MPEDGLGRLEAELVADGRPCGVSELVRVPAMILSPYLQLRSLLGGQRGRGNAVQGRMWERSVASTGDCPAVASHVVVVPRWPGAVPLPLPGLVSLVGRPELRLPVRSAFRLASSWRGENKKATGSGPRNDRMVSIAFGPKNTTRVCSWCSFLCCPGRYAQQDGSAMSMSPARIATTCCGRMPVARWSRTMAATVVPRCSRVLSITSSDTGPIGSGSGASQRPFGSPATA
jgi:hypothetical protein